MTDLCIAEYAPAPASITEIFVGQKHPTACHLQHSDINPHGVNRSNRGVQGAVLGQFCGLNQIEGFLVQSQLDRLS